jgi:enamine deaminase RidA (YjgF/YER057c/UK114 family)
MAPGPLKFAGVHAPVGYSHACRVGDTVYLAGQVARDLGGEVVGTGDVRAQARQAFANIVAILGEMGASVANIVKTTVYLTDARYIDAFREVRQEVLGDHLPPNTLLVVSGLARPDLLVEIEAIAVLP